jgi:hypothetical protein
VVAEEAEEEQNQGKERLGTCNFLWKTVNTVLFLWKPALFFPLLVLWQPEL